MAAGQPVRLGVRDSGRGGDKKEQHCTRQLQNRESIQRKREGQHDNRTTAQHKPITNTTKQHTFTNKKENPSADSTFSRKALVGVMGDGVTPSNFTPTHCFVRPCNPSQVSQDLPPSIATRFCFDLVRRKAGVPGRAVPFRKVGTRWLQKEVVRPTLFGIVTARNPFRQISLVCGWCSRL